MIDNSKSTMLREVQEINRVEIKYHQLETSNNDISWFSSKTQEYNNPYNSIKIWQGNLPNLINSKES